MSQIDPRQKVAILRILRDNDGALSSGAIAREMWSYGFEPSDRTVRLYLQEMEKEGLVAGASRGRRGGRRITALGIEEIKDALVTSRVGFTTAKVDTLTWQMNFNPFNSQGLLVLNVTLIDKRDLVRALDLMRPVFDAGLSMGRYLALAREGERLGGVEIPPGKAGIGTVCSVTVNGALLGARIPTVSRFGGVLELQEGRPVRFTDVIYYEGTTLDPLEVFIKSGLTSVLEAAHTGNGRIGASFREVPTAAWPEVSRILRRLEAMGLKDVLLQGSPGRSLLDFPIHEGQTGLILAGGLNPAAALEEAGIATKNHALSTLYPFERLIDYREARERLESGDLMHTRMPS